MVKGGEKLPWWARAEKVKITGGAKKLVRQRGKPIYPFGEEGKKTERQQSLRRDEKRKAARLRRKGRVISGKVGRSNVELQSS